MKGVMKNVAGRLSLCLLSLSIVVTGWLAYELGLIAYTKGGATDTLKVEPGLAASSVEAREAEISRREREVNEREKVLQEQLSRSEKVMEELQNKRRELESLRAAQKNTLQEFEALKNKQAEHFVLIYDKMEPKKAARIMDDMGQKLASSILAAIRPDRAAEILSRMQSDRARLLTEKYLGKRKPTSTTGIVSEVTQAESKGGEP